MGEEFIHWGHIPAGLLNAQCYGSMDTALLIVVVRRPSVSALGFGADKA